MKHISRVFVFLLCFCEILFCGRIISKAATVTKNFNTGYSSGVADLTFCKYTLAGKNASITYDDAKITHLADSDTSLDIMECIKKDNPNWNLVLSNYGASNIDGDIFVVYEYTSTVSNVDSGATFAFSLPSIDGYTITSHACGLNTASLANNYITDSAITFTNDSQKSSTTFLWFDIYVAVMYKKPSVKYTYTTISGEGGTIDPSGTIEIDSSEEKTFTITPSAGYQIADVIVNGSSVGAVTSYKVSHPQSNGTIEAKFQKTETSNIDTKQKSSKIERITTKNKSVTITWKKQTKGGIKGYEIQYSTDKAFDKNVKIVTVKSAKTSSKTIKKLKPKTRYYIRIRTFTKKDGTKTFSKWSKTKSVKVK